jgi:hypothetical protein
MGAVGVSGGYVFLARPPVKFNSDKCLQTPIDAGNARPSRRNKLEAAAKTRNDGSAYLVSLPAQIACYATISGFNTDIHGTR